MGTNYVKKARTIRLPVISDLQINSFSVADISVKGSYILNGSVFKYPDGTFYLTQRPSCRIFASPGDDSVTDTRGRGVFYWAGDSVADLYIVNNDRIYKTNYGTLCPAIGVGRATSGGGSYSSPYLTIDRADAPIRVGDLIELTSSNPAGYDGLYTVFDKPSTDSFRVVASDNGALTSTVIHLRLGQGTEKVEIAELGDDIVFLDAENNVMLLIDADDSDFPLSMKDAALPAGTDISFTASTKTINSVSDRFGSLQVGDGISVSGSTSNDGDYTIATYTDENNIIVTEALVDESAGASVTITSYDNLPQNQSKSLAHGIVVLDQTMYVLATDGVVHGSGLGNAQDWADTLNVITAEREEDAGVYLAKHHEHLVVFGRRTIEFMYDAGNATGSPLAVRQDLNYNVGCADPNSVWQDGDDLYFLGIDYSGQIRPYVMREFQLAPLTNDGLSSFITTGKSLENVKFFGSGFSTGGVSYYILTTYVLDGSSNVETSNSLVYNSNTEIWTEWEWAGSTINNFPAINFTVTDDSRIGEGILADGRLFSPVDNFTPYDSIEDDTDAYVISTYVDSTYVLSGASGSSDVINLIARIDNFDNDSRDWKFAHQLRYVGDETTNSNNLTIKWNDGDNVPDTYSGTRTIDLSANTNKLTRLGRFKSRSFEIDYSGTEQIRIKGLDLDVTEGTH